MARVSTDFLCGVPGQRQVVRSFHVDHASDFSPPATGTPYGHLQNGFDTCTPLKDSRTDVTSLSRSGGPREMTELHTAKCHSTRYLPKRRVTETACAGRRAKGPGKDEPHQSLCNAVSCSRGDDTCQMAEMGPGMQLTFTPVERPTMSPCGRQHGRQIFT